ncbi:MAG: AraC family transcriptional regulator [Lachnospiraceae bacterium]|nr:AraC family transcriptional regulator [Lachnospiraceae bacterium]
MKIEKEQIYHQYLQREKEFIRAPYQSEFEFYAAVRSGDVSRVKQLCEENFEGKQEGWGLLSTNPLQNLKYHFAITVAMIARQCIEGGMELSDSYSLSDFYIRKADESKKASDITDLHKTMCVDYAKKMRALRKKMITSMPVARAVDYIYDHLHTQITLEELADYVKLNPAYFSRLFKKEMGIPVSTYIRRQKVETAKNMLAYSEFQVSQIAQILAFPSQSYFAEIFKKETGFTPMEYKRNNLFKSN